MGKLPRRQRMTQCLRFAPSVLTQIAPLHSATSQTPKTLTGAVVDQAALYDFVAKIRDIALPLLSVKRVEIDEWEGNLNANTSVEQQNGKSDTRHEVLKWPLQTCVGILIPAAILFVPAGRLDWIVGWAYIGVFVLVTAVTPLVADPELLIKERGPGKEDSKNWDRILVSLYGLVSPALAIPLIAALDLRFGWLPEIPPILQVGALVLYVLGWAVHLWAMASNKFFSKVLRIQSDRGHTVATGGPYQYVRHPGYTGGILLQVAAPITLGSLWALIPGGLGALLLIIRTALEDKTLREEHDGYRYYAGRVRYRLLPGIW